MIAVVKYGYGPGETELRDVPIPEIGDDDVLVEVKAAGVCGSDVAFDDGGHKEILFPPVVLGHEFSGVVCKVGKNVTKWKPGDRVMSDNTGEVCGECYACNTADFLSCPERKGIGYGMDGGFTNYVKILGKTLARVPHSLMRIPDCMSYEEAAIMDPACNGYMAVVQEAKVMPGDFVAVFGVGTLGLFSIQAARAAGAAKIIAVALSADGDARFDMAVHCGATHIIKSDLEDAVEKIKELTNGEGVSCIIDAAGVNILMPQMLRAVRTAGIIVKIGYDHHPYGYSLDPFVDGAISLKGHFGYDWVSWRNVSNLVQAGKWDLKCMISHRLKVSQFREAFDLLRRKESIKTILYPENLDKKL
ncbi:MAG: alcohol dehydrogenase catalytic domain-containing protein [Lachnospiraceae bacterium]|nr:alcohol dehydrogenase catalytic domain-containing protein [Lachnospiraceae bacterium]